jgi:hypothetical protein
VAIALTQVIFPNMVYGINAYNNVVSIDETSGNTVQFTIPEGNYTGSSMASELESLLNTYGAYTYTVSYDDNDKKLTISYDTDTMQFVTVDNSAYNALGIEDVDTVLTSPHTASWPVQLQGTDWVEIRCSTFSCENETSGGIRNILWQVPVKKSYGSVVFYEPQIENWIHTNVQGLAGLDIQLYDNRGNRYVLPGNCILSLTLHVKPLHRL